MQFAQYDLDLTTPRIMGVLNVTPDSFYDGGSCYKNGELNLDVVVARAEQMVADGAHFIDVGGESTRPGATPVTEQQECDRVLPVVEALAKNLDAVISVDTSSAAVIRESAALGAGLINDVRALTQTGALDAAVKAQLPVCLMHMQGSPSTMQASPKYGNALAEVMGFLDERKQACINAGLSSEQIILDPGIGFGKTDDHNLTLLRNLEVFNALGPVLLGVSRKSMFGRLLGRPLEERLAGSLAVAMRALTKGVSILRVHDVAATTDVIKIWQMTGE